MNIIGLSAFYHDSSCCLLRDGKLIAAAAEERFSRLKHDARLPAQAFRYCLKAGGLGISDLDCVAYYENPDQKRSRQLWQAEQPGNPKAAYLFETFPVEQSIRECLGYGGPILFFDHHLSHAASSFYYSGFEQAALLTVDGVGEWATTSYGLGTGGKIELFEKVHFPHSLGLLYATLTAYLGFRVNDGEYKVMGLAPYGQPRFVKQIRSLFELGKDGSFKLHLPFFDFVSGQSMYTPLLCDLLGELPRQAGAPLRPFHLDLARSIQLVLEEVLLEKTNWLAHQTGASDLCMAGGVALNCVANGRVLRESPFKRLFVQPAAGDDGACLGAAALAWMELSNMQPGSVDPLQHVYLGPSFSSPELRQFIQATGLPFLDFSDDEKALLEAVSDRLVQYKVIGWFQGAMEFGPRALGARSILANPMDTAIRERVNRMVKKRESFRPFAPSVLEQYAADYFDLQQPSPYMLLTCQVKPALELPGITHVDGSARPQTVNAQQNPRYAALLESFYARTGCPVLLNTSFNVKDEPIVCSPIDALSCMIKAGLDCLILGDFLIDKEAIPSYLPGLIQQWQDEGNTRFKKRENPLEHNLYSFV